MSPDPLDAAMDDHRERLTAASEALLSPDGLVSAAMGPGPSEVQSARETVLREADRATERLGVLRARRDGLNDEIRDLVGEVETLRRAARAFAPPKRQTTREGTV